MTNCEPECLLPSGYHKIMRNNNIGEIIKNGWSARKAKREAVIHEIRKTSEKGHVLLSYHLEPKRIQ